MATKARQQYFADEISLQKQRREFSLEDNIKQKIDSVEAGAQVNVIEIVKVNGTALTPDANKAVNVEVPDVIDNLYTQSTDDALSAKQGKVLYDYIQNIASRGRFLSNWNSATGLPATNPSESPYAYRTGDYYIISNIATGGGTNYRPDGSSYIIGQASTTVETDVVDVSDFYFYDGTNWLLLVNTARQIVIDSSLSTTSINPVENRVITNALNGKQETLIAGNNIQIAADGKTISATDTTYTAGSHISISNANVISTTGLQEELTAGDNITIGDVCTTESDMKGPCPSGFHIPTNNEFNSLINTWIALGGTSGDGVNFSITFKIPLAGRRYYDSVSLRDLGSVGAYWTATPTGNDYANHLFAKSDRLSAFIGDRRGDAYSIRAFKNTPEVPDNTWTTILDGSSVATGAGIFYNTTSGLISASSNGVDWLTIQDKNLGATVVWNDGDTLNESNCGCYYQWGNNYGFQGTITNTSSTQVNTSGYGPGNYYNSDTYIKGPYNRSSVNNGNLRGGVTQSTWQDCNNVISATDTTYTASDFDIKDLADSTSLRTKWNGKVGVSADTGNELAVGANLWFGTTTDFSSIVSPDANTMYIQYVSDSPTPPSPWQPGANTIVYFPFDTDMNDHSGNNRTMTTYGTISLSTSVPNIGTALYVNYGSMNSGQFTSNTSLTISGWIYQTQAPLNDSAQVFGFSIDAGGGGPSGCNFIYANSNGPSQVSNKPGLAFFNRDPTRGSSAYNISNNTWYHCVGVYDKDTGKTKMYVNGQYYTEYTPGRSDPQFYRCISRANGINRSFYGYMSELIGESKARTAQEIADYYDLTKSNYGIS